MYCLSRQHNMPLCTGLDGSDGTRARDLRRDRPNRAPRRSSMDIAERLHLQVLLARRLPLLRVVEPILESTFGPRMGHGILSNVTTRPSLLAHPALQRRGFRSSHLAPPPTGSPSSSELRLYGSR